MYGLRDSYFGLVSLGYSFVCCHGARMVKALDPFLTWRPTSFDCLNPLAYLVAAIDMRVRGKGDHLAAGMLGIGNAE